MSVHDTFALMIPKISQFRRIISIAATRFDTINTIKIAAVVKKNGDRSVIGKTAVPGRYISTG